MIFVQIRRELSKVCVQDKRGDNKTITRQHISAAVNLNSG